MVVVVGWEVPPLPSGSRGPPVMYCRGGCQGLRKTIVMCRILFTSVSLCQALSGKFILWSFFIFGAAIFLQDSSPDSAMMREGCVVTVFHIAHNGSTKYQ